MVRNLWDRDIVAMENLGITSYDAQNIKFITGQNEREETTQDAIVTKSAAFASYEINYLTYITATYTRAKRRWHGATAHAPPFSPEPLLMMITSRHGLFKRHFWSWSREP
jgi:hypothetical protein